MQWWTLLSQRQIIIASAQASHAVCHCTFMPQRCNMRAWNKCHLKVNGLKLKWQFKANFRQWGLWLEGFAKHIVAEDLITWKIKKTVEINLVCRTKENFTKSRGKTGSWILMLIKQCVFFFSNIHFLYCNRMQIEADDRGYRITVSSIFFNSKSQRTASSTYYALLLINIVFVCRLRIASFDFFSLAEYSRIGMSFIFIYLHLLCHLGFKPSNCHFPTKRRKDEREQTHKSLLSCLLLVSVHYRMWAVWICNSLRFHE